MFRYDNILGVDIIMKECLIVRPVLDWFSANVISPTITILRTGFTYQESDTKL